MALTLYGSSYSRSLRVLWMLKELDLPFEHIPLAWKECSQNADYLAINPTGTIPTLVDDGFVLAESLAINLHLARRYGRLWPATEQDQALCWQWSLWAVASMETSYIQWADHTLWRAPEARDPALAVAASEALQRPLARLEQALKGQPWLLGHDFSVADLNVAGCINGLRRFDLTAYPTMADWLNRCLDRPAYRAATQLP